MKTTDVQADIAKFPLFGKLAELSSPLLEFMQRWISPLFDLGLRLYVADVFLRAGWQKVSDWESTLVLFQYEYHVPLISPAVAAALGTGGELTLPLLLIAGLGSRFAAGGLSVLNVVAVLSYPDLSDLGRQDHLLWGMLLLVTFFHGPGRWSMDALLQKCWRSA